MGDIDGPDAVRRQQRADRANYRTDENLRRRQELFRYVRQGAVPQPVFSDLFTWGPDATVVDLGCGNGLWTSAAVARTPEGVVAAADLSPGMALANRGNAPAAAQLVADAHGVPLRGGSVDVVLAAWMLYHVSDKARALGEIARVLRSGGRLLAATNSRELFPGVDEMLQASLEEVLGRRVTRWFPPLDFTAENGEAILATVFGQVSRTCTATDFVVTDGEAIAGLAASLVDPIEAEIGQAFDVAGFVDGVRRRAEERLRSGPITFTRRAAFFIATDPRG